MAQRMEIGDSRPYRKWLLRFVVGGSVCTLLLAVLFFSLPWLLIAPAVVVPSDTIFYFPAGASSETDLYVMNLYRQGVGKRIVCLSGQITWNTYPADFARERLIQQGLPESDVTLFHLPRTDCDAGLTELLISHIKQQGWKRVLIVTAPSNSRSAQRVWGGRFAQEQIGLAITYAPTDRDALRGQWWREHRNAQKLVGTGIEILLDLLYPSCW